MIDKLNEGPTEEAKREDRLKSWRGKPLSWKHKHLLKVGLVTKSLLADYN
jgi:hypothetical protein